MIYAVKSLVDKAVLKNRIVSKQRLYAQMLKDEINGPVLNRLSEEIGQLNHQLYGHGHNNQRG